SIPANRVAVNRVIDRTVTDALFFHVPDNGFEGRKVTAGIAVKLHIADVTGVGQRMIWRFQLNLQVCLDRIIYRYVERIGVILSVSDARQFSVFFAVHFYKTSAQPLGRGGKQ